MSLRSDPLDRLVIPDGTVVEEHDLVTNGDVVVGGQSTVEFGVRGRNVVAGERVTFGGDIEADGDCRLDMWCDVAGNVLVGQDAYLGERVHVEGQLMVSGDLDIGDDVDIERGFEANGWIVIRNPMPTIVFIFVYLSQLLRLGEEEAAQELVDELQEEREYEPVLIPRSARVSDDAWRVSTPAAIGNDCRLHGNIRAKSLTVGADTEIFGSLRARGDVTVGPDTLIIGNVTTKGGTVRIAPGAEIRGEVSCEDLELDDEAEVQGAIRARGEMEITHREIPEREPNPPATADAQRREAETEETDEPIPAITRIEPTPAITRVEPEPAIRRVEEGTDISEEEADTDTEDPDTPVIPDAEEVAGGTAAASEGGLAGALADAERDHGSLGTGTAAEETPSEAEQ
ncbi:polymer-forming cytoskeletal protein [Natronomonas sp. EA1]|uniref:polymer-forming cytoskeletal protein n=1 Tax=Natronomonas sp. EA1 TaxID=3421655 RepID=UPI003EBF8B4E